MTQGFFSLLRRTLPPACALAGLLVCAAPAAAAPLCSGGEDFVDGGDGICRNFFPGDNAKFYLFNDDAGFEHLLRITVDQVLFGPENETDGFQSGGFGLRFTDNLISADTTFEGFPEFSCVAYGPGGTCVEYEAITDTGEPLEGTDDHPINGIDYLGPVTWLISWIQPVGTFPIPEILHEMGEESPQDDLYDEILEGVFFSSELGPFDFACDNPYYSQCIDIGLQLKTDGDPTRAGTSNNFTKAVVVQQNVPEPATLALLGVGVTGLVLNRRRRNSKGRD